jgi:hypothetical protein
MTMSRLNDTNHRDSLGMTPVLTGCAVLVALALWVPVARVQLIDSGLPAMFIIVTVCLIQDALNPESLGAAIT